jgi:non-ribosomal peptide synthetase component E (peptide arylation enzyme)
MAQDIINDQVIAQPSAQAIASVSINFTYKTLDECSSWLAARIISLGIGRNSIVPIICEKVRIPSPL